MERKLDQNPLARATLKLERAKEDLGRSSVHSTAGLVLSSALINACEALPWIHPLLSSYPRYLAANWLTLISSLAILKSVSEVATRAKITPQDHLLPWSEVGVFTASTALVLPAVVVAFELMQAQGWVTVTGAHDVQWIADFDVPVWGKIAAYGGMYTLYRLADKLMQSSFGLKER